MRVLFIGLVLFGIGCQSSTYKGNDQTIERVGASIFQEVINQGGLARAEGYARAAHSQEWSFGVGERSPFALRGTLQGEETESS